MDCGAEAECERLRAEIEQLRNRLTEAAEDVLIHTAYPRKGRWYDSEGGTTAELYGDWLVANAGWECKHEGRGKRYRKVPE